MDIYLTPSGGSRIQFPMLPEAITMGADAKFMTYSIISLGDVNSPWTRNKRNFMVRDVSRGSAEEKQVGKKVY